MYSYFLIQTPLIKNEVLAVHLRFSNPEKGLRIQKILTGQLKGIFQVDYRPTTV